MKKRKYGFTLIELLVTIFVISLVLGTTIFFIGNVISGVADKIDKTTRNMILNAADKFVLEFRNNIDDWKENISNDGTVSFCISLNSLIETGYYDAADEFVIENKEKLSVSVIIDSNKVSKYEIIDSSEQESECKYVGNSSFVDKDKVKVEIKNDDGTNVIGSVEYDVDKINDNVYGVNVDFLSNISFENILINKPVYVVIILDNSGSLSEVSWNRAKDAAISLSKSIVTNLDNSQVALIQYNDKPMLVRGFEDEPLSEFVWPSGSTNVSGGLDLAASLYLDESIPSDAMVYTVLLYDGIPSHISHLKSKSNGNILNKFENSSVYYSNFLPALINSSNSNYTHYTVSPDCGTPVTLSCFEKNIYNYIENAVGYLKNNINSKLITIGYNFNDTEGIDVLLKELSSLDNDFCKDSSYKKEVEKDTNIISIDSVDIKTKQIIYPFSYDKNNKNLTSFVDSSVGSTTTYGRFEVDLTKYSSTDLIDLAMDYTVIGNNSVYIYITNSEKLDVNVYSSNCDSSKGCYGFYNWSDAGELFQTRITGGKKYYFHLLFSNDSTNLDSKLVINDIFYSKVFDNVLFDSGVDGYSNSNSLVKLSSNDESKIVFEPVVDDDSIVLTGGKFTYTTSGGYSIIDLSGKTGEYLLSVDASISDAGLGIITVTDSKLSPNIPTKAAPKLGMSYGDFDEPEYSTLNSLCNQENLKCLVGESSSNDLNFKLAGDKKYYIHYIQEGFIGSFGTSEKFKINDISLYKINNKIDSIFGNKLEDVSSDDCVDDNLDIFGCLNDVSKEENDVNYGFKYDNSLIISTNNEQENTCSHSYLEIDLSDYDSDKKYVVSFDTVYSIYGKASGNWKSIESDYGNIIITNASGNKNSVINPSLIGKTDFATTCDINDSNSKCVVSVTDADSSETYYATLNGGEVYHVHFMYCKVNATIMGKSDFFGIKEMSIFETVDENMDIINADSVISYNDYSFIPTGGSLVSSNTGVGNSLSHSYLTIDLSSYTDVDRFKLEIDEFCSHGDISDLILVKDNEKFPNFSDANGYPFRVKKSSCNSLESLHEIDLSGGIKYYLHLFYGKDMSTDLYDDIYKIDNIKLIKKEGEIVHLDLSLVKGMNSEAFTKTQIDGKLVYATSNEETYTDSYSYFEVDLTNYSSNRKYVLSIDKTVDKTASYRIYATTSSVIPYYLHSTVLYSDRIGDTYATPGDMMLTGGYKYYVHMYGYNTSDYGRVVINDIVLKELVSDGDSYCYYDSNSSSVVNLFEGISNKIETSVPSINADKLKITLSVRQNDDLTFHIVNKDGVKTEDFVVIEGDISTMNNKLSLNDYKIVIDDANCPIGEICSYDVKLFNIKLNFIVSDNPDLMKEVVLSDDDLPTVNIMYQKGIAIN